MNCKVKMECISLFKLYYYLAAENKKKILCRKSLFACDAKQAEWCSKRARAFVLASSYRIALDSYALLRSFLYKYNLI